MRKMPGKAFDINPTKNEHVDLNFLSLCIDRGHIAYAYREAADTLVEAAASRDRSDDALYLPTAYLYRHALESYLKKFLDTACAILSEKEPPVAIRRHSLQELWKEVKPRLQKLDWDDESLNVPDAVIAEFDRFDPKGETFRYAHGNKGESLLLNCPPHVDASTLRAAVDPILAAFMGLEETLDAMFDAMHFIEP